MGDDDKKDDKDLGGGGEPPKGTGADGAFTQDDVTRIAAEAAAKAKRSAERAAQEALDTRLSGKSLDDLIALSDAAAAADRDKMSDAEKALADAQKDRDEAARLVAEAKQERHDTRVRSALTKAGVPEDALDVITVPGLTVDSSADDVTAAVDALKEKAPGLFTSSGDGNDGDPGAGGGGAGGGKRPQGTVGAGGREQFEARFGKKD